MSYRLLFVILVSILCTSLTDCLAQKPLNKTIIKVSMVVTDQINNSVGGARVQIGPSVAYTKENGIAVFEGIIITGSSQTLPITVDKPGYSNFKSTETFEAAFTAGYKLFAQIFNDKGYKKVSIHVVANDDGKPVSGASINALGENNSFSSRTDVNGVANIYITSPDDFQLVVKHAAFFEENRSLNIKKLDDDKTYSMEFIMKRKKPVVGGVITVEVKDVDLQPVKGASVDVRNDKDQRWVGVNGDDGKIEFHHNFKQGEICKIRVWKAGYKSFEKSITVGTPDDQNSNFERVTLLKGLPGKVQFVAQVFDHAKNKPIALADVGIEAINGNVISDIVQTNSKGEASLFLSVDDIPLYRFRLMAMARNYERKWSDIPADLLAPTAAGKRYLQIYLDPKKSANNPKEKYYGEYKVNLSNWVPTGVRVKKGSHFRVDANGYMFNPNAGKGVSKEMHPDGYGAWNWYALSVRIGKNVIPVGRQGTGESPEEGLMELGAPRSQNIFPGDDKDIAGDWTVKLYATDAVQTNPDIKVKPESAEKKMEAAKTDLEFLKEVLKGGVVSGRYSDPNNIVVKIRWIIGDYSLSSFDHVEEEQCINTIIAHYKFVEYPAGKRPSDEENKVYNICLQSWIDELQSKIDSKFDTKDVKETSPKSTMNYDKQANNDQPSNTQQVPSKSDVEKAQNDLEFLKKIGNGEMPQNSNVDNVMSGIDYVMSAYKLFFSPLSSSNDCRSTLKNYLQFSNNGSAGLLTAKEKYDFNSCIKPLVTDLENKVDEMKRKVK